MEIELNFITGLMLGFEYVDMSQDDGDKHIVLDVLFLRIVVSF
jgi:hypothetical protein